MFCGGKAISILNLIKDGRIFVGQVNGKTALNGYCTVVSASKVRKSGVFVNGTLVKE